MEKTIISKIVSLCKRRGFIFGGSEIYGGLSSIWDYGPLGARMKKKIKDIWWDRYVIGREDIAGLDSAIIMHRDVFVASGHLEGFADYLVECPVCKKRFRIDKIDKVSDNHYTCPECKADINTINNKPKKFNLMFKTNVSASEDNPQEAYLRPETAQGIFTNFANVMNVVHKKLPFGIAQIGKAFRNEVTTGSFIFRMKEFDQMEIEYFVKPSDADKFYELWVNDRYAFYTDVLGIKSNNLRKRQHSQDELAHYARACTDIEYNFPFPAKGGSASGGGWSELEGIANRTDYDLRRHAQVSKKDLTYFDNDTKTRYFPYVIEPSSGVDRTFLALICDAYNEEEVKGRKRVVLKLKHNIAPYQVAVFPLLKKNPEIIELAKSIFYGIKDKIPSLYDDTAAIGKLYRRQDEIGTPFCITVDVDSLTDKKVTLRERDTMVQERVNVENILEMISDKLSKLC